MGHYDCNECGKFGGSHQTTCSEYQTPEQERLERVHRSLRSSFRGYLQYDIEKNEQEAYYRSLVRYIHERKIEGENAKWMLHNI